MSPLARGMQCYGASMKNQRIQVFRTAVDGLVESLDAVIRLSRWTGPEAKPEPLVASAAKLQERLGSADRLASARFQGTPTEVTKVESLCGALRRLDVAYLAYRKQVEGQKVGDSSTADALAALETELAATTSGVGAAP